MYVWVACLANSDSLRAYLSFFLLIFFFWSWRGLVEAGSLIRIQKQMSYAIFIHSAKACFYLSFDIYPFVFLVILLMLKFSFYSSILFLFIVQMQLTSTKPTVKYKKWFFYIKILIFLNKWILKVCLIFSPSYPNIDFLQLVFSRMDVNKS